MYTVGRLAKKFGLSRSTLLYYDYIGLLSPMNHSKGSYRQYSEEHAEKLERICTFRKAGVSLKEIAKLLDAPSSSEVACVLEQRLSELADEMQAMQRQQQIVAGLLKTPSLADAESMDKEQWSRAFYDAGFSDEDMQRWHTDFERMDPEKHAQFLRYLKMPEGEIGLIRAMAAGPHRILNLQKASEKFMEALFRFYENVPRKGPGSFANTKRAFALCDNMPDVPAILNIGCGNGADAIDLAKMCKATIRAVDLHEPYLDEVVQNATKAGVADRITVEKGDMAELAYPPESFDAVWSEGAAYIMGFDAALAGWKQFIKPGGYLVVSEAVWLVDHTADDMPQDLLSYWQEGYPAMRNSEQNKQAIGKAGYELLGNFVIPGEDWDTFYDGLEAHIGKLSPEFFTSEEGVMVKESTEREIALYRKYAGYYGYEFYVMRK